MEKIQLNALPREKGTKGQLKQLRHSGFVPGVIYGHGDEPRYVSVDGKQLSNALHTTAGNNVILEINDENKKMGKSETVMVKDLQREIFHPENLTHVDLIRISLDQKVDVAVPVHLVGEPESVKEGGVLQIQAREVNVRCLPTDIPESVEADISALGFGDSLLLKDLSMAENVEILDDPQTVIVSVLAPTLVEETTEPAAEGEEGAVAGEAGAEAAEAGDGEE